MTFPVSPTPLGLIAGNGQFPLLVAEEARRLGRRVISIGIEEETDPSLQNISDSFHWVALGQIKKTLALLKEAGVRDAIMAGQVKHTQIFRRLKLDTTAVKIMASLVNKKTDTILSAVAEAFSQNGIQFLSSTVYLEKYLVPEGPLTRQKPSNEHTKDIVFGYKVAKDVAGLDLGQTVCVKDQSVLAVEAMEGTDACIRRAGEISGGEFVVVKVAKPKQDLRFDVPVIGLRTLSALKDSKARVLAVEAGKTLLFNKDAVLEEAALMKLVIVGIKR